jgi:asparagine synthase (glutamine-hydrolysing)
MCGFVGFLLSDDAPKPDLSTWSECIYHRGPDQGGSAVHQGFGIGTRRLSILDLSSAGNQPMESERYILGFNGEIYNHLELRAELSAAGVTAFTSHSDTETILRGIDHWGIQETLSRLNGMYALAIWDKRSQQLTLARDPLGVKPLLYLPTRDGLYFGSELKALRPFTSGVVSREGMALYLLFGFVPAPYSLLEMVRKVRPGEALVFNQTGSTAFRIVPSTWRQAPSLAPTLRERVQQVRDAVEAAVRRQLLSDVPVGLFLSGGVDSSIIAAVAAAHNPDLTSFSIRPDATLSDPGAQRDAELAGRLARSLGLKHYELLVRPDELEKEFALLFEMVDEPVSELYFAAEVLLSRKAREAGVPVVLTGHGGDEVFLGYPTYKALIKGDRYNYIPFFGPMLRLLASSPQVTSANRENWIGAASVWRKPFMERYAIVSAVHFSLDEVAVLSGLKPDHVRNLVQTVLADVRQSVASLPQSKELSTVEMFARMDMLLKVPEHYNMRLDKATMVASIEARVPLQDLELIGLVAQLPLEDLWQGGLKGLLKKAFVDILPGEVAQRPKQTFQAPMLSWIQGPLASWVAAQLAHLPAAQRGALAAPDLNPHSSKQAYRLWSLGLLEGWRNVLHLEY